MTSFRPLIDQRLSLYTETKRPSIEKDLVREFIEQCGHSRVVVVAPSGYEDVRRYSLVQGARFVAEDSDDVLKATLAGLKEIQNRGYDRIIVVAAERIERDELPLLRDCDDVIYIDCEDATAVVSLPITEACSFDPTEQTRMNARIASLIDISDATSTFVKKTNVVAG